MQKFLSRLTLLLLLCLPLSLHAAATDVDAVLARCGVPTSDTLVADSVNYPDQQRVLTYPEGELHFEHEGPGWNFIFSTHGLRSGLTRSQTERFMPCFGRAMYDVQVEYPLQPLDDPPPPAPQPTLSQRIMEHIDLEKPLTVIFLVLIYFFPSIVGFIRSPIHLGPLVIINVFLGWTILGWLFSLVLAFGPCEFEDQPVPPRSTPPRTRLDSLAGRIKPGPGFLKPTYFREALANVPPDSSPSRPAAPLIRLSARTSPPAPNKPSPPPPQITWTEQYQPHRRVRIEYAENPRHYTVYDIALSCRGVDEKGREYIGGFAGKTFTTFRADRVLRTRNIQQ